VCALTKEDLCEVGQVIGALERVAQPKAVIDSRKIVGGEIFFALKGERTDGHNFIEEALQRGAALAVVSEAWYKDNKEKFFDKLLVVPEVLSALQALARLYRRKFTVPIVAIGGGSGKTTTKEMIAAVLRTSYNTLATEGNLNNHIGLPLTLFGLREATEIAVLEMGMNHKGEMLELCEIAEPTHGLITNIGKAHIEFFGTLEAIAEAEGELFEWLGKSGGTAFVNADDAWVMQVADKVMQKMLYGIVTPAHPNRREVLDLYAEEIGLDERGRPTFKLATQEAEEVLKLRMSGRHNITNALAAAAVGLNFGISLAQVKAALENFEINPALKRMAVYEQQGVIIINDTYNANPESMRCGLQTLKSMKHSGKKIAVLGDMLELGALSESEHTLLGEFISQLELDVLFVYGEAMKATLNAARVPAKQHFESKAQLAKSLKGLLQPGDAVLFKGSRAMKMEEVIEMMQAHH
jgi:UDP-N-acetylmuramoyl-tripeptide--D-alanyl-D-alanine ligase